MLSLPCPTEVSLIRKISLTNRIFLISLLIAAFSSIALSSASFLLFNRILTENINEYNQDLRDNLVQEFQKSLGAIEAFSDYLFLHSGIREILNTEITDEKQLMYFKREIDSDIDAYLTSRVGFTILSLTILGRQEQEYLYGYDVNATNFKNHREKKWAESYLILRENILWVGLYNRDDIYKREKDQVISLMRFIIDPDNGNKIGLLVLELSPSDFLKNWKRPSERDYSIFLFDGDNRILYPYETHLGLGREDVEEEWNQKGYIVTEDEVQPYGWKIAVVQSTDYRKQLYTRMILITVLIFIIVMILYMIMFFFMINRITFPLRKLNETMHKIREGDQSARYHYSSEDEIGYLTNSFNIMLDQIDDLMRQNVLNERLEREAEYRALQAQMNPHFLYNTLNSIRWMAIIQKADNIVDSIEILSRLLRAGLNLKGPIIPLKAELKMLDDYVALQKIRYKSKFEYECRIPDKYRNNRFLKYLLQPVVENAVFHGIEPKEGRGTITLTAEERDDVLILTVLDDGIGLDLESFNPLDDPPDDVKPQGRGNRIGLKNIEERIKNQFGSRYGIYLESEQGEFTRVILTIPLEEVKEKDGGDE